MRTHDTNDGALRDEIGRSVEGRERARAELAETTRTLERVNARLVAAEALKGRFLANIRNEIKNPLTAILGLAREIPAHAVSPECLAIGEAILEEASSLDFQLRNILAAAEIEAGEASAHGARVDARRLLEETVASFSATARARGLRLEFGWRGAAAEAGGFQTDPAKLALVVANLVSNAVKFAPEGTAVAVTARRTRDWLSVRVEDAGAGIPPGQRELVFERFLQLDSGPAKARPGHGLGLAVVQALLEILGGSVEIDAGPGPGCAFTAMIPALGAAQEWSLPFADAGNALRFEEQWP